MPSSKEVKLLTSLRTVVSFWFETSAEPANQDDAVAFSEFSTLLFLFLGSSHYSWILWHFMQKYEDLTDILNNLFKDIGIVDPKKEWQLSKVVKYLILKDESDDLAHRTSRVRDYIKINHCKWRDNIFELIQQNKDLVCKKWWVQMKGNPKFSATTFQHFPLATIDLPEEDVNNNEVFAYPQPWQHFKDDLPRALTLSKLLTPPGEAGLLPTKLIFKVFRSAYEEDSQFVCLARPKQRLTWRRSQRETFIAHAKRIGRAEADEIFELWLQLFTHQQTRQKSKEAKVKERFFEFFGLDGEKPRKRKGSTGNTRYGKPRKMDGFRKILDDKDCNKLQRMNTIRDLAESKLLLDPETMKEFLTYLKEDDEPLVRMNGIYNLGQRENLLQQSESIETLIQIAHQDPDGEVKMCALEILRRPRLLELQSGNPEMIDTLMKQMQPQQ